MLKLLLRGRVLCGSLCQLFSLVCVSFCFSNVSVASVVDHRLVGDIIASSLFQNEHPVTLTGNGIPLRAVFKAIKKQTGYAVMYSTSATSLNQDEKVTVNFKETPLDDVLGTLFKGRNLEWQYSDDILLIRKKEFTVPKKNEVDSTVTPVSLTGKVTDANGTPLPGVTVILKGTSLGTTTDGDGRFSLPKVDIGKILVFSSIGFERRETTVKGKSLLVEMATLMSTLDEKVIIAYGTTTQRLSTGNIGVVRAKDIEKQPVTNPLLALQGRVPGLFITQTNGLPGGGVTVRIQGQNSIMNGSDPLYVIDGVPYSSQLPGTGLDGILGTSGGPILTNITGNGNPLSYINPADIESIQVLKDADATAIYGSRAANGAILITTKKGKAGPIKLDIDFQRGWGKITRRLNMLNTQQYLQMRKEAKMNDSEPIYETDYDINGLWDTTRYTDWQKVLIGKTSQYTHANASISGGTAVSQYLIGSSYHRETSVFPGNFVDERASIHFNITSVSSNQKFNIQLSGNYLVDNNKLPSADLTNQALLLEPNAPQLYNADGSLNWEPDVTGFSSWNNPLRLLHQTYKNKTNNLLGNINLSYHILPSLEFKSSLGYTNMQTNDFQSQPITTVKPESRPFSSNLARFGNRVLNSWTVEPQVIYDRNFGKGKLNALLGMTIQQNSNKGETLLGEGFSTELVLEDIKSAASVAVLSSFATKYKYNAFFSRLNYNYNDKYIVNLTARRDGSSRFGSENQFHNFASVGAAWIFSQENLFKKRIPVLSFGKLRASFGTTGNDQIGDYNFMNLYFPITAGVAYQNVTSIAPLGLPNPYLQWEETKKLQLGIDLGLFKDRILINAVYARNRSSNQLLPYRLPTMTGFSVINKNLPATVQNTNWEFSLNTVNYRKENFTWTSYINLTVPQNKLISFPTLATSTVASSLIIGQPINITKTFPFLGVDPESGKYQFSDKDGKPTFSPNFSTDRTAIINTSPKFYGGFQNSFNYKNFQLDILFQFVKQTGANVLFFNGNLLPGQFYPGFSNQPNTVLNNWKKTNDIAPIQKYSTLFDETVITTSSYAYSDASYVRLKNLSISYQIPNELTRKAHLKSSRLYMQGQNLITITGYKGLDPENKGNNSLPPLRVITFGLQIGL
ncbi:SusC/RagA family TonB-linked outer membrane protein [Chitinophaga agrisoli]|uniref:SusC/RagA family TonB-linked outer membrane protein n=1 Tax=Chitinophaga agrisoli TaxID=2607653 RepID=A0A5B2VKL0_9BACT|nr:SusC/RagA family TonB-linked outer membrane protein [Chitinophaga agrisoli]KAA2238787.1 SusC/RagA family TonB-linked outer membrane protein [Chitinophaga agrisoli]